MTIYLELRGWTKRRGRATFGINSEKPEDTENQSNVQETEAKSIFRASGERGFVTEKAIKFLESKKDILDDDCDYIEMARECFDYPLHSSGDE